MKKQELIDSINKEAIDIILKKYQEMYDENEIDIDTLIFDVKRDIERFVKQIIDDRVIIEFFQKELSEWATMFISSKEDINTVLPTQKNKYLKDYKEIKYRNLDSNNVLEFCDYDTLKEFFISNIKTNHNELIVEHYQFCLDYLETKLKFGHPNNLKKSIMPSNVNELYDTNIEFKLIYFPLLKKKIMIMDKIKNSDNENINNFNFFDPFDLHLDLLDNCADELIKIMNEFFDNCSYHLKNHNLFNDVIQSINNLINAYEGQILYLTKGKSQPFCRQINEKDYFDRDFWTHFECLIKRLNRDKIFHSLSFLIENNSNTYFDLNIDYPKIHVHNKKSRMLYYTEKQNYNVNTFKNNMKLINEYKQTYKINEIIHYPKNVPNLYYVLDPNNLLTEKVLYHEFVILKNEHVTNSHEKSLSNVTLTKVLKNINSSIKELNDNAQNINYKYIQPYNNEELFESNFNEKNELLYYQSLLLSEKFRRGYYRELNLEMEFQQIYGLNKKLRSFFTTNVFQQRNIDYEYIIIYSFFLDLINFLGAIDF